MPNQPPRLSVVIPAYNVEKYVKAAVDSVVGQSSPADEIVIVDDGSTDRTGQIVEELYGQLPHVRIIHTRNGGLGAARNVGTAAATGDFVYYFDSDDILADGLFADFRATLQAQPDLDLFCFSARSFLDDGNHGAGPLLNQYRQRTEGPFPTGEDLLNFQVGRRNYLPTSWLYIHRRTVSQQHGLEFLPIIHEDEEHTPRLFVRCGRTFVRDKEYFLRRVRADSIMTRRKSERNIHGYYRAVKALETMLRTDGFKPETYQSLRKLILRVQANAMIAIRAGGLTLTDPALQQFQAGVRRAAMGNPKLFLVTFCYPGFVAAKAVRDALRPARHAG
ncbi:glycosyltransferase [Inquilinus limosus]|uniref:glycosyltransferase n=1 Tax=Inquilinus limosus TaxID=171674 RepID=UPI00068CAA5F|nr:glycosyltransferase [Inquilinus limosus]